MRDLRQDLKGLWPRLSRLPDSRGGRVILFISSQSGEGTSSVAASVALIAAQHSERTAWLIDLDLRKNPQYTAFSKGIFSDMGRPGHALDASLGAEQIYALDSREADGPSGKLLNAHQITGSRLLVTRFRIDRVGGRQKVHLRAAPHWWAALRRAADWVVIDAPALTRTRAGLAYASQADGVVLVVAADDTAASDAAILRREIEAQGGAVLGVVVNRLQNDARFAGRFGG